MSVLGFIRANLDHYKTRFIVVFIISILNAAASFLIPVVLAEFTKQPFTQARLINSSYFVIGLYVVTLILSWIIRKYGESLGPQFQNHIRYKYFQRLERLPLERLHDHHSGYVLSLVNQVARGMFDVFFSFFWGLAGGFANLGLFFFFMARESVPLALVNFVILAVFLAVSTYLAGKIAIYNRLTNLKTAAMLESYADFLTNIVTVKKLGISVFAKKKLAEKNHDTSQQIQIGSNFHAWRWFVLHALFGLAFIGTIVFLLSRISAGTMPVSVLILFIAAYGSIRMNIERLSEVIKTMSETRVYIQSLEEIIGVHIPLGGKKLSSNWEKVVLKNLSFQYPGNNKVISVPEFKLSRGEKVCIIGKSGEGKTTLLNIIANFYAPEKGRRLIGSQPYEQFGEAFFQDNFVMVSQEVELFNLPLRENITLGAAMDDKEIERILDRLDLLQWSKKLKDGLDTVVGEKGVKLSAGQKQRINLVRGLLLNKQVYLLDEPTSHLDGTTEQKVIEYLRDVLQDKTVVIVSHHEPLKQLCSRIYQFEDHSLIELK
jgi:ATP-binding cassette subfamily B protein